MAEAGNVDRAQVIARTIDDPDLQATTFVALASVAPQQFHALMARALQVGDWRLSLETMARTAPEAVIATTAAYLAATDAGRTTAADTMRSPLDLVRGQRGDQE